MAGDICLVGGDEFRSGCLEMDRELVAASGQSPARVVIIPTAQRGGAAKAASDGIRHFTSLGAQASSLMVLDRAQADDGQLIAPLRGASVIYFTGGSPEHLLATLRGSRLLQAVLEEVERGAVLAGSSAGAMVQGSVIRHPSGGLWSEALGLVPGIAVLPHHEGRDPSQVVRELAGQAPPGLTILGIDAQAGCLGRPGRWRAVGSGKITVYRDSKWSVYDSGEMLPPDV